MDFPAMLNRLKLAAWLQQLRCPGMLLLLMPSAIAAVAQPLDGRLKVVHDTRTLRIAYRADSPPILIFGRTRPAGRLHH